MKYLFSGKIGMNRAISNMVTFKLCSSGCEHKWHRLASENEADHLQMSAIVKAVGRLYFRCISSSRCRNQGGEYLLQTGYDGEGRFLTVSRHTPTGWHDTAPHYCITSLPGPGTKVAKMQKIIEDNLVQQSSPNPTPHKAENVSKTLWEPEQPCPVPAGAQARCHGMPLLLQPWARCCCLESGSGRFSSPPSFTPSGICFLLLEKKIEVLQTSVSYITFKVTHIKRTKSTFLLMEWPFANEVISDITAEKKEGISFSFSPFSQTQWSGKFCRICCMCTIFQPAPQSNVLFE